jgi:hypothetical protein
LERRLPSLPALVRTQPRVPAAALSVPASAIALPEVAHAAPPRVVSDDVMELPPPATASTQPRTGTAWWKKAGIGLLVGLPAVGGASYGFYALAQHLKNRGPADLVFNRHLVDADLSWRPPADIHFTQASHAEQVFVPHGGGAFANHTTARFDDGATTEIYSAEGGTRSYTNEEIANAMAHLPFELRTHMGKVVVWNQQFVDEKTLMQTWSMGLIIVYPSAANRSEGMLAGLLAHEGTHALAFKKNLSRDPMWGKFLDAQKTDPKFVSKYAKTSPEDDLAETAEAILDAQRSEKATTKLCAQIPTRCDLVTPLLGSPRAA